MRRQLLENSNTQGVPHGTENDKVHLVPKATDGERSLFARVLFSIERGSSATSSSTKRSMQEPNQVTRPEVHSAITASNT